MHLERNFKITAAFGRFECHISYWNVGAEIFNNRLLRFLTFHFIFIFLI